LGHIISEKLNAVQKFTHVKGLFDVLQDVGYYGLKQKTAKLQAQLHYVEPTMEEAFEGWNIIEHPIVCSFLLLRAPVIGYDKLIHVPQLFPKITRELILQEYAENSFNKLKPMHESEFTIPELGKSKSQVIEELFVKGENKIPIRILAPEHLDIRETKQHKFRRLVRKAAKLVQTKDNSLLNNGMEGTIVIHIHGGGFVSMTSAVHRVYLNQWVNKLNVVHFSIDYKLAPEHQYPAGLNDCWQSYLWIMNYCESVLGKEVKIFLD